MLLGTLSILIWEVLYSWAAYLHFPTRFIPVLHDMCPANQDIMELCARIQCLQADEAGIYTLSDVVSVPVSSIIQTVSPPSTIRHKCTFSLLTVEVSYMFASNTPNSTI